jgi:hypothetical protein
MLYSEQNILAETQFNKHLSSNCHGLETEVSISYFVWSWRGKERYSQQSYRSNNDKYTRQREAEHQNPRKGKISTLVQIMSSQGWYLKHLTTRRARHEQQTKQTLAIAWHKFLQSQIHLKVVGSWAALGASGTGGSGLGSEKALVKEWGGCERQQLSPATLKAF